MPASPLDSAMYGDLFADRELARLFSDTAEVRAMLLVEGALAKVQGAAGLIPELSATFIHRASMELQVDPSGLAAGVAKSAVPVPALVAAFRKAMEAPEHAPYVHWGATSQDIMDTALVLRLRQVVALLEERIIATLAALGAQAEAHAALPMAGRTYGQLATPTSYGALLADWGQPLLRHLDRLGELKPRLLVVSLSGAAGNLSAMDGGPEIRTALASALGLNDPAASWHNQRDTIGEFAGWLTGLATSLGKIGEDLILLTHSGVGEVTLASAGGSSTMPQKQNPVLPSVLVALARQTVALNAAVQGAGLHRQQRDGAAWFTEWLSLPQLVMATGRAAQIAAQLAEGTQPNAQAMARGIDPDGLGLIAAEALSFALARSMPRPDAQAAVKDLCAQAQAEGKALSALAQAAYPDANLSVAPADLLGTAPDQARAFAKATRALKPLS